MPQPTVRPELLLTATATMSTWMPATDAIGATITDGVLTIEVPKSAKQKTKSVAITEET